MSMTISRKVFGFSPIAASGSAYALNLSLILLLDDQAQYAQYLSLNAWAIYISTFCYLLIIDLWLSPNRAAYLLQDLMSLSIAVLIIFAILFAGSTFYAGALVPVFVGALGFSSFKLLTQYFVYRRDLAGVAGLRYGRAFCIAIVVAALFLLEDEISYTGSSQVVLQGVICIFLALLLSPRVSRLSMPTATMVRQLVMLDGMCLLKRNASFLVDMIHMPIFYLIIAKLAEPTSAAVIYSVGILVPAAYVVSVILREQALIRDDIMCRMLDGEYRRLLILVYLLAMAFAILLSMLHPEKIDFYLLLVLALMICFSGAVGAVMFRLGMEKRDLLINLTVAALMVTLISPIAAEWSGLSLALSTLSLKFFMQLGSTFVVTANE